MVIAHIFFDFFKTYTANAADCVRKILFSNIGGDSDCFKNLRALVRLNRADAHFGGNLYDAVDNRFVVVVDCSVVVFVKNLLVDKLGDCFVRKIRIDCARAVAKTHRRLMHVAHFGCFKDNRNGCALFSSDEVLLNS